MANLLQFDHCKRPNSKSLVNAYIPLKKETKYANFIYLVMIMLLSMLPKFDSFIQYLNEFYCCTCSCNILLVERLDE